MRIFDLTTHIKSISRSGRRSAVAAAYRACTAITCEREGRRHDYSRKRTLEADAIVLPAGAPDWAADRSKLWNAAELRERNGKRGRRAGQFKANAVTARQFLISFPAELSANGRWAVALTLARHLADTHGLAVDVTAHKPHHFGDERNHYCHMLTTTRRLTADGLGKKAREWDDLKSGAALVRSFRALVAHTLNAALADEGLADRLHVEHRSHKAQGLPERPTRHEGSVRTAIRRRLQARLQIDPHANAPQ